MSFEARTKYAILGGKIAGKVLIKLAHRSNKIHIFVDKKNRNKLAPKFKVDVHLQKDGAKAVDLTADTTVSPYVFKLTAPNFFTRWGIQQSSIDITADHQIGKSLV
jgi:hypothetical protein